MLILLISMYSFNNIIFYLYHDFRTTYLIICVKILLLMKLTYKYYIVYLF
jgi:hypothetical protein